MSRLDPLGILPLGDVVELEAGGARKAKRRFVVTGPGPRAVRPSSWFPSTGPVRRSAISFCIVPFYLRLIGSTLRGRVVMLYLVCAPRLCSEDVRITCLMNAFQTYALCVCERACMTNCVGLSPYFPRDAPYFMRGWEEMGHLLSVSQATSRTPTCVGHRFCGFLQNPR